MWLNLKEVCQSNTAVKKKKSFAEVLWSHRPAFVCWFLSLCAQWTSGASVLGLFLCQTTAVFMKPQPILLLFFLLQADCLTWSLSGVWSLLPFMWESFSPGICFSSSVAQCSLIFVKPIILWSEMHNSFWSFSSGWVILHKRAFYLIMWLSPHDG